MDKLHAEIKDKSDQIQTFKGQNPDANTLTANGIKMVERDLKGIDDGAERAQKEADRLVDAVDDVEGTFRDNDSNASMAKIDFEIKKLEDRKQVNEELVDAQREKLRRLALQWQELEERIMND